MKEGWTYKKLGEVCEIYGRIGFRGYTREDYVDTIEEGAISLSPSNIINNQLDFSNCTYITWDKYNQSPEIKIVEDDVIFVKTASVGKCAYVSALPHESTINPQFVVFKNISISNRFLFYQLLSSSFQYKVKRITSGTSVPTITQKGLSDLSICYPNIAEQEHIVSELDLLSGIIEKKKEQLKEYDKFAQSIFYDMFGDPITNEKGWEVKKIDNICESIVRGPFGSALKKDFFVEPSETTYKVYEQKHAIQKNATIGSYYITEELFKDLSRFELRPNDIIMSCSGTIGELYRLPSDAEKGLMNQALLKFTLNNSVCYEYFLYMMEYMKHNFVVRGSGLQNIGSVKIIKTMSFGLPPLTLQQSFAEKIEAIERQKALVQQSISETQTLFDCRMDYYFN